MPLWRTPQPFGWGWVDRRGWTKCRTQFDAYAELFSQDFGNHRYTFRLPIVEDPCRYQMT